MRCGTFQKQPFCRRGYAEIHIQRPVFENIKGIEEIIIFKM
jgi:hypothetical protein